MARQHSLAEGVVVGLDQDHDFGLEALDFLRGLAPERTVTIDGMDDGPGQGQEHDLGPFELQQVVAALQLAVARLDGHEHDAGFQIHQGIGAAVDQAKLEALAVLVGCDEQVAAEADAGRGAGDTPEQESGGDGKAQHADQRFEGRHKVGGHAPG